MAGSRCTSTCFRWNSSEPPGCWPRGFAVESLTEFGESVAIGFDLERRDRIHLRQIFKDHWGKTRRSRSFDRETTETM